MNSEGHFSNSFLSNFIDEKSVLEKNVSEHPASSIARFLLWRHYQGNEDAALEKFSKQSVLFFNNPHWLQFQLHHSKIKKVSDNGESPLATEHFAVTIPTHHQSTEVAHRLVINEIEEEEEKEDIENPIVESSELPIKTEQEPAENLENQFEQNQPDQKAGNTLQEEVSDVQIAPESEEIETNIAEENSEETPAPSILQISDEIVLDNTHSNDEPVTNENINSPEFEIFSSTEEIKIEEENTSIIETSTIENPVEEKQEDVDDEELAFEPLHTVDYFASQGIKIKEEALLNDKLGKQMKSFTDWLKTMKKLHPGKLPEQNEVIERIIQVSAEESNADAAVLTEAMAEVLVMQDKKGKAIEMYEKLSLINPTKSAYFAAKIESIKNP